MFGGVQRSVRALVAHTTSARQSPPCPQRPCVPARCHGTLGRREPSNSNVERFAVAGSRIVWSVACTLPGPMQPPVHPPRVAIADDEASVRTVVKRVLRAFGAEVAEAADGAGLRALVGDGHRFDLVITDLRMPRWTGASVLHEMRARGDTTPAILLTGDVDAAQAVAAHLAPITVLPKPFSLLELASTIHRVLALPIHTADETTLPFAASPSGR